MGNNHPSSSGERRDRSKSGEQYIPYSPNRTEGQAFLFDRNLAQKVGVLGDEEPVFCKGPKVSTYGFDLIKSIRRLPSGDGKENYDAVPVRPRPVLTQGNKKMLPFLIKWAGGGKDVKIAGTFNQWHQLQMVKSEKDFIAIVDLPEGDHEYKFLVDGEWKVSREEPVRANDLGTQNNVIVVRDSDFREFENALLRDPNDKAVEKGKAKGEQTQQSLTMSEGDAKDDFSQDIPEYQSWEKIRGPPVLPPHLLQVILNKDTPISCEPTLLPEPNHVMLNHMYALSIRDGMMVLSTSHRYRKKFVLGTNMDGDFGIVTLQQQPAQELPDIAQFLSVYMAEDDPMIVHGRLPEGAVHHSVPHSVFSNGTMETQQQHHVHHRPDGATVTSSHGTIVLNPVVIKGQQEQVLNHGIRSSLALLPATKGPNEGTSSSTSKKTPAGGADGKKHVCTTCNKQFSRSDKLTLHRRTHTGERPYVCFCGKRFTRSDHLKIHALKHKMDAELRQVMLREAKGTDGATNSVTMEPTAISSLCVKVENDNQYGGSSNGASESGNAGEQRQECHVCQKVFGSIYKLGRHLRTHTGEKPYMCFCGDKFSRSDALRTHQRSKHTPSFIGEGGAGVMTQGGTGLGNLVQVKCEPGVQGGQQLVLVSSAQPTQPHQMLQQQLPQTGIAGVERERGEKPPSKKKPPAADGFFPCDYCSKTFNAGYKLTVHLRYHTGEKPYACDTCGKAFARRDHMKKHRKIHFK